MFHFVWQSQFEHQKLVEQLTLQFPIVKKKKRRTLTTVKSKFNKMQRQKTNSAALVTISLHLHTEMLSEANSRRSRRVSRTRLWGKKEQRYRRKFAFRLYISLLFRFYLCAEAMSTAKWRKSLSWDKSLKTANIRKKNSKANLSEGQGKIRNNYNEVSRNYSCLHLFPITLFMCTYIQMYIFLYPSPPL